ncbi:MAG: hypothetical protein AAGF01_11410 [Cyanobacteria bacterium P01_G01_bin.38]
MLRLRLRLRHLFALSLLITTAGIRPASASSVGGDSMGLDFSLPTTVAASSPAERVAAPNAATAPAVTEAVPAPRYEPLSIPKAAISPPVQTQTLDNPKVYGGTAGAGVAIAPNKIAQLPPPPPAAQPTSRILSPSTSTPLANTERQPPNRLAQPVTFAASELGDSRVLSQSLSHTTSPAPKPVGLSFDPDENKLPSTVPPENVITAHPVNLAAPDPRRIFEGGSDSLVARIVGSAEGTRTADGERTTAYYGHVDPGNGVWNLGTFSYQHGANSPEEADIKQLARLQRQGNTLEQKATLNGIQMSLLEKLNGLDLANQSPRAALERGGYIERLAEARQQGLDGADAILWARTHAYMDPDTQRWNAPGLGNTHQSITRDQDRRLRAINRALDGYATPTVPDQQTLDVDKPALDIFEDTPSDQADQPTLEIFDESAPEPAPEQIASAEPNTPTPIRTNPNLFSAPGLDSGLSFALRDQPKPASLAKPQTRVWQPPQPAEIPREDADGETADLDTTGLDS